MRILRFLKMARIARVLQNFSHVFQSLFLLIRALQVSLGAVVWAFVILFLLQVLVGLCMCNTLVDFMSNEDYPEADRHRVFEYFGTFERAMITMFEISTANWVPSCRFLMDKVSLWYGLFFMAYRCMLMFAVVRVISAVFFA